MKKMLYPILIFLTLALSLLCLRPLDFYQTLQGMRSVANGAPGTFAWGNTQQGLIVLAWQQGKDYAFVVVNQAGDVVKDLKQFVNATNTPWKTFGEFGKWLEDNGYKSLLPVDIPVAITMTLRSYSLLLVAIGSKALPTLWMVPIFPDILTTPTWSSQ